MCTQKKGMPPMPLLGGDGTGMDNRVTIGRYLLCRECLPEDLDDPNNVVDLTADEEVEVLASAPLVSANFKGWVETPDWIVWEGTDGSLHVANGRDPETGAILGDSVIVPRIK